MDKIIKEIHKYWTALQLPIQNKIVMEAEELGKS